MSTSSIHRDGLTPRQAAVAEHLFIQLRSLVVSTITHGPENWRNIYYHDSIVTGIVAAGHHLFPKRLHGMYLKAVQAADLVLPDSEAVKTCPLELEEGETVLVCESDLYGAVLMKNIALDLIALDLKRLDHQLYEQMLVELAKTDGSFEAKLAIDSNPSLNLSWETLKQYEARPVLPVEYLLFGASA